MKKARRDPFAVEWIDTRQAHGEERVRLLGLCGNTVLYVAYAERGDNFTDHLLPWGKEE